MTKLLGLDIGTTGVRCVAIDERGDLVADASEEYPLYSPQPGWSEQRPEDWWEASQRVIASVATRIGRDVSGIGLAGQMHGAVFLDQKDTVIRPALLWNDQRTEAQCQAITERVGARRLTEITGNPALTGFQAPKILWLRDEEPKAYERVAAVLLPKDYIRLKLTGKRRPTLQTRRARCSSTSKLGHGRARSCNRSISPRTGCPRSMKAPSPPAR